MNINNVQKTSMMIMMTIMTEWKKNQNQQIQTIPYRWLYSTWTIFRNIVTGYYNDRSSVSVSVCVCAQTRIIQCIISVSQVSLWIFYLVNIHTHTERDKTKMIQADLDNLTNHWFKWKFMMCYHYNHHHWWR